MSLRTRLAVGAGKTIQWATRRFGLGGGTNLPGRIARRIAPKMLQEQIGRLHGGAILVSGTNGKTTTARMIATILEQAGASILHNRAGANLITGLAATALDVGIVGHSAYRYALFEVDEAHLPAAILETKPRVVVLLNLFRDQLDRYGEVDTIAAKWRVALQNLPASSTIVLNADDPVIADLGTNLKAQVCYYGLDDERHGNDSLRHAADSIFCLRCGTPYEYTPAYYGHIGRYRCPACGHARPTPHVSVKRLELDGVRGSTAQVFLDEAGGHRVLELNLPIPGLYNAMNATAAIAATVALGETLPTIRAALEGFSAAFGRIERFTIGEHPVLMALVKNPIGASETVRMLTSGTVQELDLLIAINDKIADGTDVSWLWDAEWEPLVSHCRSIVVSGTRAADMAVRLKYAGVDLHRLTVVSALDQALDAALGALPQTNELILLPTYTAMLELRESLVERGILKPFWES